MKKRVLLLLSALLLAGCEVDVEGDMSYAHADKYSYGDKTFTETISKLDVGFFNGDLDVTNGTSLSVSEKGEHEPLTAIHHWVEEDTLHLHDTGVGHIEETQYQKDVTLTIPNALDSIVFDVTAGNVFSYVDAKEIQIESTVGNFQITSTTLERLTIDVTTGNIDLYIPEGKKLKITADSVIGNIDGEYEAGEDITIDFTATIGNLSIHRIEQAE